MDEDTADIDATAVEDQDFLDEVLEWLERFDSTFVDLIVEGDIDSPSG